MLWSISCFFFIAENFQFAFGSCVSHFTCFCSPFEIKTAFDSSSFLETSIVEHRFHDEIFLIITVYATCHLACICFLTWIYHQRDLLTCAAKSFVFKTVSKFGFTTWSPRGWSTNSPVCMVTINAIVNIFITNWVHPVMHWWRDAMSFGSSKPFGVELIQFEWYILHFILQLLYIFHSFIIFFVDPFMSVINSFLDRFQRTTSSCWTFAFHLP